MTTKKQKIIERYWHAYETEKAFKKKYTSIQLNNIGSKINNMRKVIMMEKPNWTDEDILKLESNRRRPISELVNILKGKFPAEDIEEQRQKVLRKEQALVRSDKDKKSKYDAEDFYKMFTVRDGSFAKLELEYPELLEKYNRLGLQYIFYNIRKECKGIDCGFSTERKALLDSWMFEATGEHIQFTHSCDKRKQNKFDADRVNASVQDVRKAFVSNLNSGEETEENVEKTEVKKRRPYNRRKDELNTVKGVPFISVSAASDKTEAQVVADNNMYSREEIAERLTQASNENHECCCCNSIAYYGLQIGSDIVICNQSRDFVEGALSTYIRLGFTQVKKIKFHPQEL